MSRSFILFCLSPSAKGVKGVPEADKVSPIHWRNSSSSGFNGNPVYYKHTFGSLWLVIICQGLVNSGAVSPYGCGGWPNAIQRERWTIQSQIGWTTKSSSTTGLQGRNYRTNIQVVERNEGTTNSVCDGEEWWRIWQISPSPCPPIYLWSKWRTMAGQFHGR